MALYRMAQQYESYQQRIGSSAIMNCQKWQCDLFWFWQSEANKIGNRNLWHCSEKELPGLKSALGDLGHFLMPFIFL